LLLLLLVAASCAGGDDPVGGSDAAREAVATEAETTTTVAPDEPSAASVADVIPYLEDLLTRYDAAVNEIVADPSIAADAGNPTVAGFLDLFASGNEFATGSLDGWTAQAARGVELRPASDDRGVNTTTLEGPPRRIDDDTIVFGQCTVQSYVVVTDGEQTGREDRKLLPGTGRAVRIDGHWLLEEIATPPDAQGCISQGGGGGGSG
jgi:hypothetical protein